MNQPCRQAASASTALPPNLPRDDVQQLNLLTLCPAPACQVSPAGKHGSAERRHNRKRGIKTGRGKGHTRCSQLVRRKGRKSRTDGPDLRIRSHFTFLQLLSITCYYFRVIDPRNAEWHLPASKRHSFLFKLAASKPPGFVPSKFLA